MIPELLYGLCDSSGTSSKEWRAAKASLESPAKQLAGFIAKFDTRVGKLIRSTRLAVRGRFPISTEIVYDKYHLALGFCSSERPSDCVVSLAANAKGVGLCFYYGATCLILMEFCKVTQIRHDSSAFESAATLANPAVETLLKEALKQAKNPMPTTGKGQTIIKSISTKQRPRRTS